jgi:hypothetical protein
MLPANPIPKALQVALRSFTGGDRISGRHGSSGACGRPLRGRPRRRGPERTGRPQPRHSQEEAAIPGALHLDLRRPDAANPRQGQGSQKEAGTPPTGIGTPMHESATQIPDASNAQEPVTPWKARRVRPLIPGACP